MLMMRQVHFEGHGGPDVIRTGEAPVPEPGPGQVLIEVAAVGVNRPDCLQREGVYPPPSGETRHPGLEIAGRVVARGEDVSAPREGDDVCALVGSGGYAEYALAHALLCLPVPKALGVVATAGIPENYFTVFDNVLSRGKLAPGQTFLVHGGSSGIGSTAIQLAKQIRARVIATAGLECKMCVLQDRSAPISRSIIDPGFRRRGEEDRRQAWRRCRARHGRRVFICQETCP